MAFATCHCGITAWQATGLHVIYIAAADAKREEVASRTWWPDPADEPRRVKGSRRAGDPANILLHRVLMDAPPKQIVDHANGNPLDNRRINLRFATRSQNMMNRAALAGLKGTYQHRPGVWRAEITVRGHKKRLGCFASEEEAHAAYIAEARKVQGEFFAARAVSRPAKLNSNNNQHCVPAVHSGRPILMRKPGYR